ncbi:MAG: sensor histidine kinase [Roseiflexaceae bacterium]
MHAFVQPLLAFIKARRSAPSGASLELRMEHFFIVVRWCGIGLLAPVLPLTGLAFHQILSAYSVLVLAAIYNLVIARILRDRPSALRSGYITTIGDGLLNIAMLSVGGGFSGPFYYILFTMTISAVMRYGYGPAMIVVGMYVGLDLASSIWEQFGIPLESGAFFFRSAFLMITTMLAGYLREQARTAESALAYQLHQASTLNESTQALSTSLDLAVVTNSIAEAVRQLTDAGKVLLHLGPPYNRIVVCRTTTEVDQHKDVDIIMELLLAEMQQQTADSGILIRLQRSILADGHHCLILRFASHQGTTGALAVIHRSCATPFTTAEQEILCVFVDRAALALENALLYEALADRTNEVRRAYAELASAHEELLGIDEMKTSFLANVSHELRTPLTAIRSFSEILLSYESDHETQKEFMGIINSESERLTRLINDVLDITKIEAGRTDWHIDLVRIDDVLRESARTCAALIEEKGLSFELELPAHIPPVWADRDRTIQIVANLLGNAIKFTNHGKITLTAHVIDNEVHTSVTDTGIGIAPEDHERIFEKFQQVGDTLTDKPNGTGLGLCLCRNMIAHQGGRIWVDSVLGQGSTFTFSLPLAESMEKPAQNDVMTA